MDEVGLIWGIPRDIVGQCTMGSHRNGFKKEGFILSVDVGTTSVRCHVYDKQANIRGSCTAEVCLAFSQPHSQIHHLHISHPVQYLNVFFQWLTGWCFVLWSYFIRLCHCTQRWGTWRWTRTRYGQGLSLWSRELCKVQLQHQPAVLFIHSRQGLDWWSWTGDYITIKSQFNNGFDDVIINTFCNEGY